MTKPGDKFSNHITQAELLQDPPLRSATKGESCRLKTGCTGNPLGTNLKYSLTFFCDRNSYSGPKYLSRNSKASCFTGKTLKVDPCSDSQSDCITEMNRMTSDNNIQRESRSDCITATYKSGDDNIERVLTRTNFCNKSCRYISYPSMRSAELINSTCTARLIGGPSPVMPSSSATMAAVS
jgi:hypothetical protein